MEQAGHGRSIRDDEVRIADRVGAPLQWGLTLHMSV